ncbi:MAG TPA: homoserine kinase [bacterium]|nr:homoserine kinase [bacterium]HPP00939.1 homoserine kinase [bacterium]
MTNSIRLTIPASSGNLGPGFDTMGIAVNLHNTFELSLRDSDTTLDHAEGIDPSLHELCLEVAKTAAQYFFEQSGVSSSHFSLRVFNRIPIARGLASSATFRLAVLEGLNQLTGAGVPHRDIVKWASELEGCTDNAAACYYGGMTASGIIQDRLVYYRCEIPETVDFVAVSPNSAVETDKARGIFARELPRKDAIFTLNHGILLAMAFAQGDYEGMRGLFEDKIHQPQRQAHIPALQPLFDVITAAETAGAVGAYLSGSGSTMMAVTLRNKEAVAQAMTQALAQRGMQAEIRYLKADNRGLTWEWV